MNFLPQLSLQTLWQLLGKAVSSISTIILLGIITRSYGAIGTGVFTLSLIYLGFFFLISDLGLNSIILPKLKTNPEEASKLLSLRVFWSVVLIIIANIISPLLPFANLEFITAVRFGSLAILFSSVVTTSALIFQANLRFDKGIIASSLGAIYSLVIAFYLASIGAKVEYLILAPLLGWLLNGVVSIILANKLLPLRLIVPDFLYVKNLIAQGWPIFATLIVNLLYFRLDAFILGTVKGFTETGIYNLSYQIFQAALVAPTLLMNSYYPILVKVFAEEKEKFSGLIVKSAMALFLLGFVATVITLFFSPFLISILTGSASESSVEVLKLLSLSFPAFFTTNLLMWVFIIIKKQKEMFLVYLLGLLVNGILNLVFIPRYSFIAASLVTVLSEYLILVLLSLILLRLKLTQKF